MYIERIRMMDIQVAEEALKKVAERNGVSLETVLKSIQVAIQQSALGEEEMKKGGVLMPAETVQILGNAVFEAR